MTATTASPLATGLMTSSTASEILKYLERDTSGLSSKSVTSNDSVAMDTKKDVDKPIARVEVHSAEPGVQPSEALLHVEINEVPTIEEKVYQKELEENTQNQEPFVPPPVAVMVRNALCVLTKFKLKVTTRRSESQTVAQHNDFYIFGCKRR